MWCIFVVSFLSRVFFCSVNFVMVMVVRFYIFGVWVHVYLCQSHLCHHCVCVCVCVQRGREQGFWWGTGGTSWPRLDWTAGSRDCLTPPSSCRTWGSCSTQHQQTDRQTTEDKSKGGGPCVCCKCLTVSLDYNNMTAVLSFNYTLSVSCQPACSSELPTGGPSCLPCPPISL